MRLNVRAIMLWFVRMTRVFFAKSLAFSLAFQMDTNMAPATSSAFARPASSWTKASAK
jgi:hypothetical protein